MKNYLFFVILCVVNWWLLDNSRTFAALSVKTTLLDKWRNGYAMFPYLEKNILVQGRKNSRDII